LTLEDHLKSCYTSNLDHSDNQAGSSSSAGYTVRDEANGSVDSARCTSSKETITDMQKKKTPAFHVTREHIEFPFYSAPELNDKLCDLTLEDHLKSCYTSNLDHSDNHAGKGRSLSSGYIIQPLMGKNGNGSIDLNVAQIQEQDFDIAIPVGDYISEDISLKFPCNYLEVSSKTSDLVPNIEVSPKLLNIENDALAPALDLPITDIRESFVVSSALLVQKDENNTDIDYNTQQSGHMIEHGDIDLIPDLNSNHSVSMASTHSSQSASIESLEDSIADAKNKKVSFYRTFLIHFSLAHYSHVFAWCMWIAPSLVHIFHLFCMPTSLLS
jgi:hypothetical protein